MAARGPQNGQRGLKRCPPLDFCVLPSAFTKSFFWSEHSCYEKSRRWRRKKRGEDNDNIMGNSVHKHHCQLSWLHNIDQLERRLLVPKLVVDQKFRKCLSSYQISFSIKTVQMNITFPVSKRPSAQVYHFLRKKVKTVTHSFYAINEVKSPHIW